MFDELVRLGDIVQREAFRNIKALPSRLKRLVEGTGRFQFWLSRNVIAANEKHPRVLKDKLPDGNLRVGRICGVGCHRTALRQRLYVGVDVRGKRNFDDVVDAVGRSCVDAFHQAVARQQDVVRPRTRRDLAIVLRAAGGDHPGSGPVCELHCTSSDRTCTALNQHGAPLDRTADVNSPMRSYAGNAETGTLFHRDAVGKRHRLPRWHHDIFRGGTKRAIRLSAVTPDAPANPRLGYSRPDAIHRTRTITVRNNARVWHSNREGIFPLFDVARIYTRRGDANSNFTLSGLRIIHFTDVQNVTRSALLLVPCRLHSSRLFQICKGMSICRRVPQPFACVWRRRGGLRDIGTTLQEGETCAVPEGTRLILSVYPGLTPWANTNFALRGSTLRNRSAVAIKNELSHMPPKAES